MLLHSREGSGERRPVEINAIIDESLNLAYHGARAEKPGFNVTLERDFDPAVGVADGLLRKPKPWNRPQKITFADMREQGVAGLGVLPTGAVCPSKPLLAPKQGVGLFGPRQP